MVTQTQLLRAGSKLFSHVNPQKTVLKSGSGQKVFYPLPPCDLLNAHSNQELSVSNVPPKEANVTPKEANLPPSEEGKSSAASLAEQDANSSITKETNIPPSEEGKSSAASLAEQDVNASIPKEEDVAVIHRNGASSSTTGPAYLSGSKVSVNEPVSRVSRVIHA